MNNFAGIMGEIQKLQQRLKDMTVEAGTENGAVKLVLNGHQEVVDFHLDRAFCCRAPARDVQQVVADVIGRAIKESKQMVKEEAAKVTGGLGINLPGLF